MSYLIVTMFERKSLNSFASKNTYLKVSLMQNPQANIHLNIYNAINNIETRSYYLFVSCTKLIWLILPSEQDYLRASIICLWAILNSFDSFYHLNKTTFELQSFCQLVVWRFRSQTCTTISRVRIPTTARQSSSEVRFVVSTFISLIH